MRLFTAASTLTIGLMAATSAFSDDHTPLAEVIAGDHRQDSASRDAYRNPQETLAFFEVEPDMTVVEIWPGGGWYTEILAPYLKDNGKFYAAHFNPESGVAYYQRGLKGFETKLAANPELYSEVEITVFDPPNHVDIAPAGSVDRVLTFRNVHNWYMRSGGDAKLQAAFEGFYKALKPGGILGVVDHRLPEDRSLEDQEASGYMRQDYVVKMAEAAGFELAEASDINANPKDTADHPSGVWTLPPSYRLGDKDREKYSQIGESDRMTLKFVKPE